jgi:hypothetical protein
MKSEHRETSIATTESTKRDDPSNHSAGDAYLDSVLDAALEIARRRRDTLHRLRDALKTGNVPEVIRLARELCGVDDE